MSTLIESEVRARAQTEIIRDRARRGFASARTSRDILVESTISFSETTCYDAFLSHSFKDTDLILGVKATLDDLGYRTYIDWIDDPHLDRLSVTYETAQILKQRMRSSRSLLYVTTMNSVNSRWMPWECGYVDGYSGKVAILPITPTPQTKFVGLEYMSLYPYCEKMRGVDHKERLYITTGHLDHISFERWIEVPRQFDDGIVVFSN